jgi:hypothetical protein
MTISIMTISIMTLSIAMMSAFMPTVTYVESHIYPLNAECRGAYFET